MAIDQATVRKIASLARIAISDAEAAAMEGELNGILVWVEQLGEVDVTGVEPMTAVIPNTLRLRDDVVDADPLTGGRSEEHTSELQSLMRISYAVVCLNKKTTSIAHLESLNSTIQYST